MKPNIVVDIGNSRIKWGYCAEDRVLYRASLPPDEPSSWEDQVKRWDLGVGLQWAVAGVHPERIERIMNWVTKRDDRITLIQDRNWLPIEMILVEEPHRVGIDRLLNAVAAKERVQPETSIFIIDAGSAVTVDWVDEEGAFRGGTIFPGIQMMAKALHDNTAALPLLSIDTDPVHANPSLPGTSSRSAITAGIYWAVAGGIKGILRQLQGKVGAFRKHEVFLTGGDANYLAPVMDLEVELWPTMTLEGVRLAAEALP
jgi:type III pantothenate kinase